MVSARTITPTHNRLDFGEGIVVDVKIEEFAPGKSAVNFYIDGLKYNHGAHPLPRGLELLPQNEVMAALRLWRDRILDNPTGENHERA